MLRCTFFFQAEDGIRDGHVTGVQTCALPISPAPGAPSPPVCCWATAASPPPATPSCSRSRPCSPPACTRQPRRSEERRVGKESRCRWTREPEKKEKNTSNKKWDRHDRRRQDE